MTPAFGHFAQFFRCGLFFHCPFTHHVEADGTVTDHAGNVHGGIEGIDRVQISAVVFPGPGEPSQDRVLRNVFHGFHHPGK